MAIVALDQRHALELRRAYVGFWDRVRPLTSGRAQQTAVANLSASLKPTGTIVIETIKPFVILGVPSRKMAPRRTDFDIYLALRQEVEGDGDDYGDIKFKTIASNIRMIYLDARTKDQVRRELEGTLDEVKVHQGFHFDLSDESNHPVFHAQIDHACIHRDDIGRRYLPTAQRSDVPRIPTAPLDFPGVTYVLLHDHFPDRVPKGWTPAIREAMTALPRMPMSSFGGCLASGAQMECDWWYYHKHR